MAPQTTDWAVEMAKGRMATTKDEYEEMHNQMSRMGLKGAYNPANVYPGSRFTPSSKPTPEELHADTLEKRWMKKSRKKQKEMLLEAWPNMSTTHRSDYEAFRQECTGGILIGLSKLPVTSVANLWLFSSLAEDTTLQAHLLARTLTQHTTETVAHFIPEPAFLPFDALFLDGDKTSPADGLKAFELQEKIYPFLIRCCELILHDFTKSSALLDANIPTGIAPDPVVAPEPTTAAVTEILPSLVTISAEAPYRLPANIDFERLREIFAARLSAAEDYLFDLREDPGFFADTINDWSEHRNDAFYETWFLLHRQAALLCTLMEKYKDEISYNKQLPKEYLIAILKLRKLLKTSAEVPIDYLQNIQSSPPLRHHFTRTPQDPGTTSMHIMPKDERSPFFNKQWGLILILWDRKKRDLFGLTNAIDAFEQLMQDPEESKNISSYIADRFSDLAILSRALYEVENYQPWAATFDDEYNGRKFLHFSWPLSHSKLQFKCHKLIIDLQNNHQREVLRITMTGFLFNNDYIEYMNSVLRGIVPYCMPGDGKFKYPVNKKCTKQSTEQMILAEKNLDFFWEKFDANWKKLTRKNIDACFGGNPPRKREEIQRTSSWVEPLPIKATTKSQQASSTHEWAHDDEKNRPLTQLETQPEAQPGNPEPQFNVEQSKVKIPHHIIRVFNTLFFQPDQNNTPGDVPWVEFLKAMVEMGFAVHNLYGSVWQFTPVSKEAAVKTRAEKSIQFHEPPPGVKINFVVARRMGRRLMRRFGWWGGMFEEE
ncbi:uncharacterized protein EAF02_009388 [Botrytis sinoallii]|uniref:uncharacterized protein n=1 Tax=Botrytis sinoallii TaxID=1463999 RepID=UPI0018FFD242|nr:uncharacterized protein EAF02_009388 [Botrytis sinoallii]KAF7870198.1 hypothetical protein EAF02_009388 [Botrytis sinoallii]